ncbi:MAG: hypothetical protein J1E43_04005 [Christensenellaceae bacterium]|nr:hypothetical protein [Christensenellaceae bacterium]
MRCILSDLRRALTGRWFLLALAATSAALYLSAGTQTYGFLISLRDLAEGYAFEDYFYLDAASLLTGAMQGDFGLLTLPALSALPYGAQALVELKNGALRPALFRAGRRSWLTGKLLACVLSGMLLQGLSALLLLGVLHGMTLVVGGAALPPGDMSAVWAMLLRRMLCGGLWAGIGSMIALLTETSSAASIAPLCLCYALMMVGTRFFPSFGAMNPMNWLSGWLWPLVAGLAAVSALLLTTLNREVNRHA